MDVILLYIAALACVYLVLCWIERRKAATDPDSPTPQSGQKAKMREGKS